MKSKDEVEAEIARTVALPDDEQIEEITRLFSRLTPDQQATVRALMLDESDQKQSD